MNKVKKATKKVTKPSYQKRIACSNWDKGDATISLKTHGDHVSRKVLTRDNFRVELPFAAKLVETLRRGYEVRFTVNGEDAIRLFPFVEKDLKTMIVASQTMGNFRKDVFNGKKFKVVRRSKEISTDEAKKFIETVEVTPNMMVTCPGCGLTFRVGRKNVK